MNQSNDDKTRYLVMEKLSVKHLSCSCGGAIIIHPVSMNHERCWLVEWWDPPVTVIIHWNFGFCERILQIGEGVLPHPKKYLQPVNQHVVWEHWGRLNSPSTFKISMTSPRCELHNLRGPQRRQSHRKSRTRFPWWKVHDADRIDMGRFQHDFKSWHYLQQKQNLDDLERFSNLWFLGLNWTNHTNKWYHYISHGAQHDLTRIFRRLSFKIILYNDIFVEINAPSPIYQLICNPIQLSLFLDHVFVSYWCPFY